MATLIIMHMEPHVKMTLLFYFLQSHFRLAGAESAQINISVLLMDGEVPGYIDLFPTNTMSYSRFHPS